MLSQISKIITSENTKLSLQNTSEYIDPVSAATLNQDGLPGINTGPTNTALVG